MKIKPLCRLLLVIFITVAILFVYPDHFCPGVNKRPKAVNGKLDLNNFDIKTEGPIYLSGKWEFYHNEFLPPLGYKNLLNRTYIKVPALWNTHMVDDKEVGAMGYGTYRLVMDIKNSHEIYAMKIPDFASSYSLFVNGKPICTNGIVGKSEETTKPKWQPKIAVFHIDSNKLEVIVHIANFSHIKGGMWEPILLGTQQQIFKARDMAVALSAFLFGSLMIMGIYHISLFFMVKKDLPSLFLGFFCVAVAIRTILTGEVIISAVFPNIHFNLQTMLEYVTMPLIIVSFATYAFFLFPKEFSCKIYRSIQYISLGYIIVIILFPLKHYALLLKPFQVFLLLSFTYILYVIFSAIRVKKEEANLIFIGTLIFLFSVINDIAYANRFHNIYQFSNLVPMGLFVFILFQTLTITLKFAKALKAKELLSLELESKVKQRTLELEEANQKLKYAATRDVLTTLYNRQEFEDVLIREKQKTYIENDGKISEYCVMYLDLDDFKYFNDTFGHATGDVILRKFAGLLLENVRSTDIVFRIGGDEFIILLPNTEIKEARAIAKRIQNQLAYKDSFKGEIEKILKRELNEGELADITCSIGISCSASKRDFDLMGLLQLADKALLLAKEEGKNQFHIINEQNETVI